MFWGWVDRGFSGIRRSVGEGLISGGGQVWIWKSGGGVSRWHVGVAVGVTAMAGLVLAATLVMSSRRGSLKSPWSRRKRKHELSPQQWKRFFTPEGKLCDGGARFLKKVRSGGVDQRIRSDVWPFLLGVYELNSSEAERNAVQKQNRDMRACSSRKLSTSGSQHSARDVGKLDTNSSTALTAEMEARVSLHAPLHPANLLLFFPLLLARSNPAQPKAMYSGATDAQIGRAAAINNSTAAQQPTQHNDETMDDGDGSWLLAPQCRKSRKHKIHMKSQPSEGNKQQQTQLSKQENATGQPAPLKDNNMNHTGHHSDCGKDHLQQVQNANLPPIFSYQPAEFSVGNTNNFTSACGGSNRVAQNKTKVSAGHYKQTYYDGGLYLGVMHHTIRGSPLLSRTMRTHPLLCHHDCTDAYYVGLQSCLPIDCE